MIIKYAVGISCPVLTMDSNGVIIGCYVDKLNQTHQFQVFQIVVI